MLIIMRTVRPVQDVYKRQICGYEYVGEELPEDYICPLCKHPASDFEKVVEEKEMEVTKMANKYAGTQTEKNLQEAFAGESQARNKYTYFASVAKKEGYEQMSALFLKTADNEKEHAKMWFKELAGIGDTKANLCLLYTSLRCMRLPVRAPAGSRGRISPDRFLRGPEMRRSDPAPAYGAAGRRRRCRRWRPWCRLRGSGSR